MSAQELLEYLDQVYDALGSFLHSLPSSEPLRQPLYPGSPRSKQDFLQTVLMGSCGHLGEIEAMKAMMKRAGVVA